MMRQSYCKLVVSFMGVLLMNKSFALAFSSYAGGRLASNRHSLTSTCINVIRSDSNIDDGENTFDESDMTVGRGLGYCESHLMTSRRQLFAVTAAATSTAIFMGTNNAHAEGPASSPSLTKYVDEACKFSISLPSDWTESVQTLPDRRKIVLYIKPNSDQKTLVFLAFTPVRDDYTSLGSFGSADEVAEATILPKSTLAGVQGVESKMLSVESKKQSYMFDYVTEVPPQPNTHFRTIFTLKQGATGGAGNVLVTITAQAPESDYATVKPLFDKIIDSYEA
jgi:PsbP